MKSTLNSTMNATVIRTEGLAKIYPMGSTQVHALRGINLRVDAGEFVALMGASGSGKSTLMHLLGCLDTPTAGRYWLQDRDVSTLTGDQRAGIRNERIGFVFQNFNLLPRLTALENVLLPLSYRRWSSRVGADKKRAGEVLGRVGLSKRTGHLPTELSGGEQQRVTIARALINDPALILADEPTGNLDSATGSEIMQLLVELCAEGRTILMVTHDEKISAYAHRTLHMLDGQILNGRADHDAA
jgi:putative ABC transport system ATP-binding protein